MIFKQNMIVVITNGKLAGKKAVVVSEPKDNMLVVAGVMRVPVESPDYLPEWQKRRNTKFATFIKKISMKHVLATRYKADVGFKGANAESVENLQSRATLNNSANQILRDAFDNKKAKWLFTSLQF